MTRRKNPTIKNRPLKVRRLLKRDGPLCRICLEPFTDDDPPTLDHVVRWADGGGNELDNLQLAHGLCNVRRGNQDEKRRRLASANGRINA